MRHPSTTAYRYAIIKATSYAPRKLKGVPLKGHVLLPEPKHLYRGDVPIAVGEAIAAKLGGETQFIQAIDDPNRKPQLPPAEWDSSDVPRTVYELVLYDGDPPWHDEHRLYTIFEYLGA